MFSRWGTAVACLSAAGAGRLTLMPRCLRPRATAARPLVRLDWHTSPVDIVVARGVLAQPTRARLFVLLRELGVPVSTIDLARKLVMHPNGVRVHLDRMAEVGILVRSTQQPPRGRPRDMWSVSPDAAAGDPPTAYADLGRWLALAMPSGRDGVQRAEESGEEIGVDLAASAAGVTPEERLRDAFASLGFQPVPEATPDDSVTFRLCNCPYREAVRERPQIVCGLHRGITRGLLTVIEPGLHLADFIPKDPDRAGCIVRLSPADPTDPADPAGA